MLRWRTLAIQNDLGSGAVQPVPFFIQWEPDSPHPSGDSPSGCTLESLLLEHEDPPRVNMVFEALGFDVDVSARSEVRIVATLKSPKGSIDLS